MPAKEPTWTDERLELLKSRFAEGLTCREIADDIGVSRNAVIGKLSRLNLTRDKGGDALVASDDAADFRAIGAKRLAHSAKRNDIRLVIDPDRSAQTADAGAGA